MRPRTVEPGATGTEDRRSGLRRRPPRLRLVEVTGQHKKGCCLVEVERVQLRRVRAKGRGNLVGAAVSQLKPHHLWWRAVYKGSLPEVIVLRHDSELVHLGVLPDHRIVGSIQPYGSNVDRSWVLDRQITN